MLGKTLAALNPKLQGVYGTSNDRRLPSASSCSQRVKLSKAQQSQK